ncbi:unnamed protein product, partial [Ixodes hexagonus]
KYQVGPFPVKAILGENLDLKFDGKYTTSAVKALYKYYKKNPADPSGYTLTGTYKNKAGQLILTEKLKPVGYVPEPEDITHNYKDQKSNARTASADPVELKLECPDKVAVGAPIHVVCAVTNRGKEPHEVVVTLNASSVVYNNSAPEEVGSTSQKLKLAAG